MKKLIAFYLGIVLAAFLVNQQASGFVRGGLSGPSVAPPTCAAGALDTVAASPGAYTYGESFRKLRAAYSGSAKQLQKYVSGTPTQDIGFVGCDFDTASAASFCGTASLPITAAASARVAIPAGSTSIFVFNSDISGSNAYVILGNSSVTAIAYNASDTLIPARSGAWLSVGANTNIAGITSSTSNTGAVGSNTLKITNCAVSKSYDQVGPTAGSAQATQSKQFGYFQDALNSLPGEVCNTPVGAGTSQMRTADNASYKTGVVHMFAVVSPGWGTDTNSNAKQAIGYPSTASSDSFTERWGLAFGPNADQLNYATNGSAFVGNIEGWGEEYRTVPLVYDVASSDGVVRYNNTTLFTGSSVATVTYPTAVGLVIGGDAAGNGCGNMIIQEQVLVVHHSDFDSLAEAG